MFLAGEGLCICLAIVQVTCKVLGLLSYSSAVCFQFLRKKIENKDEERHGVWTLMIQMIPFC